jgi:hypothetical protein
LPFTLPDHVDVSTEPLQAIADRHGVDAADVERLPETGIFNAIYRLGDVALEFAGVPLRAAPYMLAGHREIATLDGDDAAEARVLWRHLQLSIWTLPRGAVAGLSWAERPIPMLMEVLRFFAEATDDRWREVGPVEVDGRSASVLSAGAGGSHA